MAVPLTLAALRAELVNDPLALGYAALQDRAAADLMNTTPRLGIAVASVGAADFLAAIDAAELGMLVQLQLSQLLLLVSPGAVLVGNANVRALIQTLFPVLTAPKTRANLIALATRPGVRSEELFGEGVTVNDAQVAQARA